MKYLARIVKEGMWIQSLSEEKDEYSARISMLIKDGDILTDDRPPYPLITVEHTKE